MTRVDERRANRKSADTPSMDLAQIARALGRFGGGGLTGTLSEIEASVRGVTSGDCLRVLAAAGANSDALAAASALKRIAGEVHVAIHALGILLCLPHILEPDERVKYVSLGAGNTGRAFDLETNRRIAEFKFIHWRGGSESVRQDQLFKDFYLLAESASKKRKLLYVLGATQPLRFLNGGRSLASVFHRNVKLLTHVNTAHGERYKTVRDYYLANRHSVGIEDVSPWVPSLVADSLETIDSPTSI